MKLCENKEKRTHSVGTKTIYIEIFRRKKKTFIFQIFWKRTRCRTPPFTTYECVFFRMWKIRSCSTLKLYPYVTVSNTIALRSVCTRRCTVTNTIKQNNLVFFLILSRFGLDRTRHTSPRQKSISNRLCRDSFVRARRVTKLTYLRKSKKGYYQLYAGVYELFLDSLGCTCQGAPAS